MKHESITIAFYTIETSPAGDREIKIEWCSRCGAVRKTEYFDNRAIAAEERKPNGSDHDQ